VRLYRTPLRSTIATLAAALIIAISQPAAAADGIALAARIHIDNFGKIDDGYYRGAQPEEGDYADLASLGIKTVIDLTRDGRDDEPGLVEQAGMKFFRIPLTTTDRPSDSAVAQFLSLVTNPANQPVYVHCQGGRHRTGAMTAVYRMTVDGWTSDKAYAEMKQFRFEGFPGHPVLKRFVSDYYTVLSQAHTAVAPAVK
jgi:tyrosine-protein phosphatase SIW14